MDKKVLVILGPTATGKTDLALFLAKKFNGELIACDSRQVYKGLDIGTGKFPSAKVKIKKGNNHWEISEIKIWMYDVVSLKKQYTVADYIKDATSLINDVAKRGKLPIVVGGTGLYLRALTDGLSNLTIPVDKKIRGELERLSLIDLQNKLKSLSQVKWEKLNESDRQNKRRLLRSLELSMNPYTLTNNKWKGLNFDFDVLKVGLTAPRELLYEKINSRALTWIQDGIIDEVERLIASGIPKKRFKQLGLEYGVIVDFLEGKISKEELQRQMQTVTRQYAKRQITWFRQEKDVIWFDITESYLAEMEKDTFKWYHSPDAEKD